MHGIVFSELQRFVTEQRDAATWSRVLDEARLGERVYLPITHYPDEELVAIVGAASRVLGAPTDALLQGFGQALVPTLLSTYGAMVRKEWRTLDLVEHAESVMHRAVRVRSPGAAPPVLAAQRTRPQEVVVTYASRRKLCALAKGIVVGIGAHYGEAVRVTERACMHRGAAACELVVRV